MSPGLSPLVLAPGGRQKAPRVSESLVVGAILLTQHLGAKPKIHPCCLGFWKIDVPQAPVVSYDADMENGWTRRDRGTAEAGQQAGRWLDVKQAADELGISSDAVRKRVARGTLRSGKEEDGSVRVWLDGVDDRRDDDQLASGTEAGPRLDDRLDDLIDAKDDALRDLRDQLEHMRRESERKDAIIMQMAQANASLAARVPELEAVPEPREAPVTNSEGATGGAPSEPEKRSWWREFFGLS